MELKDYYSILGLQPSASAADIKKSFRELAQQFHPDKNNNDPLASAQFAEIKEAYEILIDPAKKEYYHQQRWYEQSMGRKKFKQPLTPITLLKQSLELDKYVSTLDTHRMDKEGLFIYISELISDTNIDKLNAFNDPGINKEIVHAILKAGHALPLQFAVPLKERLERIRADEATIQKLELYLEHKQKAHRLEKLRPWAILAIVILLSLLIYMISR